MYSIYRPIFLHFSLFIVFLLCFYLSAI